VTLKVNRAQLNLDDYYNEQTSYPLAPPSRAVYEGAHDRHAQTAIAADLGRAWSCVIRPFAALCPVDYWAEKHGRMYAVVEIKTRTHAFGYYPDSYLPARKYLALEVASLAHGCPAIYAVRFTDGIYWAPLIDVDGSHLTIVRQRAGRGDARDVEPCVLVPCAAFHPLTSTGKDGDG
jgi:hypothetical protein